MKPSLVLVYNAESGLFNTVAHFAHKIFSPATYPCSLCAITNSNWGMRKEWKEFLAGLGTPFEFLHSDELPSRYGYGPVPLPVILLKEGDRLGVLVDAAAINGCRSSADLQNLIVAKLTAAGAAKELARTDAASHS
jgi:hypothetical protein